MTEPFYRDRDHAFGKTMLTLRSKMGLTQAALASTLGVTRHAVGQWEAGSSYPKIEHIKQLIALAVEHRAFSPGREAEEIRTFWQSAHQKALLDEQWLSLLLTATTSDTTSAAQGASVGHSQSIDVERVDPPQPELQDVSPSQSDAAEKSSGRRLHWGDALTAPNFFGREWEMNVLTDWVVQERCRTISVLGLGGIGKSALAVSLMYRVAGQFDIVIWRSLRDLPTCEALLDDLLQILDPQALGDAQASLEKRQSLLLEHMRRARILMVLDNVESVLEEGTGAGHMRPGYEGFGRFLRQSAAAEHQSCVVLTSREKPSDLVSQEGNRSPVRALRLARLDAEACEKLLAEKDVTGSLAERARLIEAYAGNPLALKIVAQTIKELFDGEITPFLEQSETIFGGVRQLLSEQFDRLPALEQSVLLWLAILREPATLDELLAVWAKPVPRARLLEAVESLHRRSLIERGHRRASFTLQSVVLEYVTMRLIAEIGEEIWEGRLARLIDHGLERAQAPEYVRQTQTRLIVAPLLAQLRGTHPQSGALEPQLLTVLRHLAAQTGEAQGYGPANLVALLRLLRGNLRGLDLSGLALRGVNLRGVDMQDADLSRAFIQDSVFTETFDVVTAVAIGKAGAYWASASRRGEVRVWEAGGQTLFRAWRAHTDMVWSLAFSPDERALASASWDGAVRLWDVASGALLWSGQHTSHANRVAFTPDGNILASSGNDATVRLWDVQSGAPLQVLPHPAPVPVIAWSPAPSGSTGGFLLASGDVEGSIRLWEVRGTEPAVCFETFVGHTAWVDGLAFAPDGNTLASASWDGTVKLWNTAPTPGADIKDDVVGERLMHTLTGHTDRAIRVIWSPDGRVVASNGRDKTIWLWDVEQMRYQAALRGHAAGVNGIAFTPDSHNLLSGSEDGTLRVWDVDSWQCMRVIQGSAASLYDVDWSPDGAQLVSGGADYLVTTYPVNRETPPRVLRGHIGVVFGVGWSPNGRWLASSEWDNTILLWEPTSEKPMQVLHHPDDPGNYFYGLAWSPDGQRLAGGTYRRGVLVWDVAMRRQSWSGRELPTWIRHVAWSPDGTKLAGGGDDGTLYVWDAAQGDLLQQLVGHHSMITRVAWSPDGTRLASSGSGKDSGELFIWDALHGERVMSFAEHPATVYAVAWSLSGDLLISGSGDGALRWWDVHSGKCVQVRQAHQGTVQALKRSPDGMKLASCGDDGAIMLWDLHTGNHLQTLRRDRPYERVNITGIQGLTEAQKATLRALGAVLNA